MAARRATQTLQAGATAPPSPLVAELLEARRSPQPIAGDLQHTFPAEPTLQGIAQDHQPDVVCPDWWGAQA
jgi:hypothetical protein